MNAQICDRQALIQQRINSLRQAVRDWAVARDLSFFENSMGRKYPSYAAAREVAKEARNLGLVAAARVGFVHAYYPGCEPQAGKPLAKVLVQDPVKEASDILVEAMASLQGRHPADCEAEKFAQKNKHLPANHPAWKLAPQCSCWVSKAANWLVCNQNS